MITIGLTGGIASGKSTAARYLGSKGAHVIDADLLGHRAYEPGTRAFGEVVKAFGESVVDADGNIDRKALGAQVFGKPEKLQELTGIVWPEIRRMAEAEIERERAAGKVAVTVLEAAVLFEAGWEDAVDQVWVVVVEPQTAVARAMSRDGSNEAAVKSRISAQLSNDERRAKSDVVIDNSGDEAALLKQLDAAWERVTA
ncbi:MAG: dephospho-CoA kinase [Proteobacteria bacterium]|nr:dephospho-CoA kinase [Pseudomonadota bacterium]